MNVGDIRYIRDILRFMMQMSETKRKIEIPLYTAPLFPYSLFRNTTRRFKRFYGRAIEDATIYAGLPPPSPSPVHFILECIVLSSKI